MFKRQLDLYAEYAHKLDIKHYQYFVALKFGITLYDSILDADIYARGEYAHSSAPEILRFLDNLKVDLASWNELTVFFLRVYEELYHGFPDLRKLRQELVERQRECSNWILAPAAQIFNHQKFVELRDKAIEDHA